MSTSDNTQSSSAGPASAAESSALPRPTSLRDAGIVLQDNGNYLLPPIQVHYREGRNQSLNIEVGPIIPSRSGLSSFSSMAMANMFRNESNEHITNNNNSNNTDSNSNTDADNRDESRNNTETFTEPSPEQATMTRAETSLNETETTPLPVTAPTDLSPQRRAGVRGLDYPAFDVSTEGVYNDETQPTSRFLAPLQRVFDRVYGTGSSNRGNATPNSNATSPSPVLIMPNPSPSPIPSSLNEEVPPAAGTTVTSRDNASTAAEIPPTTASPATPTGTNESRNIILTVNYVHGGTQNESNSGSLFLYVPSINENNEENVNVLVRLATDIALRTIAVTLKQSAGVSKKTFEGLQVLRIEDLPDGQTDCPICYDGFIDKEELNKSNKRKLTDSSEEGDDNSSSNEQAPLSKRVKSNDGTSTPVEHATEDSDSVKNKNDDPKKGLFDETYSHYPIKLTCGHIFGASCLSEWFKTNNSCPLCREKLPTIMSDSNNDSRITITLPNLARVISNSRPLIENFNNRQMILIPNEEINVPDGERNIVTGAGDSAAGNNDDQFPNDLFWSQEGTNFLERINSMRNRNQFTNALSNMAPAEQRQSIMNFLREFVTSLSERGNNTNGASSSGNTAGNGSDTLPLGVTQVPVVSTSNSPTIPAPPRRLITRIPLGRRINRVDQSFGGMFPPLGVASRRTPTGVETREISMFDGPGGFPDAENTATARTNTDSTSTSSNGQDQEEQNSTNPTSTASNTETNQEPPESET